MCSCHHSESPQVRLPAACLSAPLSASPPVLCRALACVSRGGARVGAGRERLVLRLCPHITTADCSSGWLGFSAKTGITDPCRLPTFAAASPMFSRSELRRPGELKRCECMCAPEKITYLFSTSEADFFFFHPHACVCNVHEV